MRGRARTNLELISKEPSRLLSEGIGNLGADPSTAALACVLDFVFARSARDNQIFSRAFRPINAIFAWLWTHELGLAELESLLSGQIDEVLGGNDGDRSH